MTLIIYGRLYLTPPPISTLSFLLSLSNNFQILQILSKNAASPQTIIVYIPRVYPPSLSTYSTVACATGFVIAYFNCVIISSMRLKGYEVAQHLRALVLSENLGLIRNTQMVTHDHP